MTQQRGYGKAAGPLLGSALLLASLGAALAQSTPSAPAPATPAPARTLSSPASSSSAAPKPSRSAPALRILKQGGDLCYSADVTVNDKDDAELSRQAEAAILKTFQSLNLKATQYDAAKNCDRELIYTFGVDVDGAPTIYNDDLKLHSYVAQDGQVQLDSVTAWSDGYYGGDAGVWNRASYTRKMLENIQTMLAKFAVDYRSLK